MIIKFFVFCFFSRHTKIPGPFNPTDNTAHKNTRNAGRCTKFPQLELEGEMKGNPLGHKVPGCKRGSGLVLAELAWCSTGEIIKTGGCCKDQQMILRTDVVKTRKPAEGHQECTKEFGATREDGPLSRKDKCNDNTRSSKYHRKIFVCFFF